MSRNIIQIQIELRIEFNELFVAFPFGAIGVKLGGNNRATYTGYYGYSTTINTPEYHQA